jgi:hypothetical protein
MMTMWRLAAFPLACLAAQDGGLSEDGSLAKIKLPMMETLARQPNYTGAV